MRLTAITLQGFKSFCDRSAVLASDELLGIVGPNGSGKSNIIDALRWGLGESRASSLRGGALQDVLFSGSARRPAADWCMVEIKLAVDKKDELGMWSGVPEIVVRRELGRDGQSHFYINNQTARRRDVVDLFRGTGVSPRSYGVVEQGMVGSIAEASPDEMRLFLEETAGISHYKDRRRDAERRLTNSRANLEQLEQLLADVRRRVESLKRQSRTARRYREMSDLINAMDALLIVEDRAAAQAQLAEKEKEIAELSGRLESLKKQLETLRGQTEEVRTARDKLQREAQDKESEWVRAQAAGEKLRLDFSQAEEKRQQLRKRLEADIAEEAAAAKSAAEAVRAAEQAQTELGGIGGELEQCIAEAETHADNMESLQQSQREAEIELEAARQAVNTAVQQRETARVQLRMADEQSQAMAVQLANMERALETLDGGDTAAAPETQTAAWRESLQSATDAAAAAEQTLRAQEQSSTDATSVAQTARENWRIAETAHAAAQSAYQTLRSLAMDDGEWAGDVPRRLAEVLQADAGEWSRALDAALGRYAAAFAADSLDDFLRDYGMPPAGAGVVDLHAADAMPVPQTSQQSGWTPLYDLVRAPQTSQRFLAAWLRGVYAAEDEETARRGRSSLAAGDMLITREGAVFLRDAVFAAGEVCGGFDWRQRMAIAGESLTATTTDLESLQATAAAADEQLATARAAQQSAAAANAAAQESLSESRIIAGQHEERQRAVQSRSVEIRADIEQVREKLSSAQVQQQQRQGELQDGGAHAKSCAVAEKSLATAQHKHDAMAGEIEESRSALHQSTIRRREMHVREENLKQQIQTLAARDTEQVARRKMLGERIVQSREELAQMSDDELAARMRAQEATLAAAEKTKNEAAAAAQKAAQKARGMEEQRERELQKMNGLQEENTRRQVEKGHFQSKVEGLDNSLGDYAVDETQLTQLRADGMDAEARREEIVKLREKRERLGAINFIAAQELSEAESRMTGMQAQLQDLGSAADELQNTIRRIDEETRTRLRAVFAGVNDNFGDMFRRLFGGGEAELAMEGDSILDARFEIRARLPGKRMFPVRMLSGGEKTATSLAFIFTLMKFTPPPFCIMDEVDAALDDARVGAFVNLLQDLSQDFQCLVVSHNKQTIESLPRLIGVTQEEKGVSKVVSVTLSEALRATNEG